MTAFERIFELYGLPERILTDNGAPFVAPSSRFGLNQPALETT